MFCLGNQVKKVNLWIEQGWIRLLYTKPHMKYQSFTLVLFTSKLLGSETTLTWFYALQEAMDSFASPNKAKCNNWCVFLYAPKFCKVASIFWTLLFLSLPWLANKSYVEGGKKWETIFHRGAETGVGWLVPTSAWPCARQVFSFKLLQPSQPGGGKKLKPLFFSTCHHTGEIYNFWVTRGILLFILESKVIHVTFLPNSIRRPSNMGTKKFWYVHYKELRTCKWYFLWGFVGINFSKPCSILMLSLLLQVDLFVLGKGDKLSCGWFVTVVSFSWLFCILESKQFMSNSIRWPSN